MCFRTKTQEVDHVSLYCNLVLHVPLLAKYIPVPIYGELPWKVYKVSKNPCLELVTLRDEVLGL